MSLFSTAKLILRFVTRAVSTTSVEIRNIGSGETQWKQRDVPLSGWGGSEPLVEDNGK